MKKLLFLLFCCSCLYACSPPPSPKEVAKEFIQYTVTGNAREAARLATASTKQAVENLKTTAAATGKEATLQPELLTEKISGATSIVKNDILSLSLQKEGEDWKVVATPEVVSLISGYENRQAALKAKWEALLKEYEARLQIARDYLRLKQESGKLSPQAERLSNVVTTLIPRTAWDKEKILLYVQKQRGLDGLIDKALEPSYNAATDLSMTYFLQLMNATDRIKFAEAAYQQAVQNTPSPVYPALPPRPAAAAKS